MQAVPCSRHCRVQIGHRDRLVVVPTWQPCPSRPHHPLCRFTQRTNSLTAHAKRGGATAVAEDYDASSIQVLEGLEPVRKRPGMYIGSTGQRGLHHLIFEVLDNCIDEVQAGHATRVDVDMDLKSGWVTVTDDGRGIPTAIHPRTGKSALETVLTVLHAGGKFGGEASGYSVSGGLHGVGVSVVNALSERLEVKVWRGGREYRQAFSRGAPLGPMSDDGLPREHATRRGTQVRFLYDPTIFSPTAFFDPDIISSRLRELAFLNPAATLLFRAHKPGVGASSGSESDGEAASTSGNGNGGGRAGSRARSRSRTPAAAGAQTADAVQYICKWKPGDAIPSLNGAGAEENGAGASSGNGNGKPAAKAKSRGRKEPVPGAHAQSLDGLSVGDGWSVYAYRGGLSEFVSWMNKDKAGLHEVVSFSRDVEGVQVDVALQWCSDGFADTLVGFANSIRTIDGGTHLDGFKAALTRTINNLAKKLKLVKEGDVALSGEHIREGLGAIVSVKVPNPEFEGQTKTRLGNPEVRRVVEGAVSACVGEWLEAHPAALGVVVAKALTAAKAADAAKKARELVRRKNVLTRTTLPGKLADCTSTNRGDTEIFVVEGDSAGGSAKQARDRHTQAVLPLRGKILNVERKDDAAVLKNQEISNLIVALGLGAKGEGLEGLRYGRVILLTDADVDGAHIRTLLLTFLFRYRRELFDNGHVYVAVPPLYKLEQGRGKITWCYSDNELKQATAGLAAGSFNVQRFKGLGEMMPDQLWDTTLNPASRLLRRLTIEDAAAASHMFALLMGDKVAPRRELIESHSSRFSLEDLDI